MTRSSPDRIFVTFWGTRGSISTPGTSTEKYGGNTPCVSLRYRDTDVIFDAGTGIRNLGMELAKRRTLTHKPLSLHLLLSHTHWDHIQGIPFFDPAYVRGTKLCVYGSARKGGLLTGVLQGQMDLNYFPVRMDALAADIKITELSSSSFRIGPLNVDVQEQVLHPGGSVRYRVRHGGKTVVYATDVELDMLFEGGRKPSCARHHKLAAEYADFIRDADLLIADAQFTQEEYKLAVGWGHSTISTVIKQAFKHGVKQLALFHHNPTHSDTILDHLWLEYGHEYSRRNPPMNVFWAREGMTLAV